MRTTSSFFLLCMFLIGNASAETITKPTMINSGDPFTPDGIVEMRERHVYMDKTGKYTEDLFEVNKTEKGILNGIHYDFYYTDGSGTFAGTPGNNASFNDPTGSNWDVGCDKDAITDNKSCHMHMKDLWVWVYAKAKPTVNIGHEHFPHSSVTIRIDGGTPITILSTNSGIFPSGTSVKVIERLKRAKSLTTRFMKWPYKYWVDDSWEIYGFNETYQYINWAVKHIK